MHEHAARAGMLQLKQLLCCKHAAASYVPSRAWLQQARQAAQHGAMQLSTELCSTIYQALHQAWLNNIWLKQGKQKPRKRVAVKSLLHLC